MDTESFHEINISKENLLSPSITETVTNIIHNEGYVTHKVYKRQITTCGGNYLGALFEVDIKGKTPDEEKEINLFVKKSISMREEVMSISCAYEKEQLFYDELAKVFEELEEKARVPEEERLRTIKGYKVSSLDAIIMENLRKQDYRTLHRLEVFSLEFAELSIKQLATFHGLSYALKEKKPEYFNSTIKTISKSTFIDNIFKEVLQNMFNITKSNLDEEWRIKLEPCFSKFADKCLRNSEADPSPINCICHGDYRQNNIHIKTINHKIVDLIPIDYQLLNIGNPLNDFFYFVYSGSDREFRKKNLMILKNLYYDSLNKILMYFDMNAEHVYPRQTFEVDFENRREMGLVVATLLFPGFFVVKDEFRNLEPQDFTKVNFNLDSKYHERLMGVLEEFEELGYFSSSSK